MKSFFIKLLIVILLLITLSLGLGVGIYSHFTSQLPQIESLADYRPSIPSRIFSSDGRLLAEIGREKREVIEISSLPQVVIDSFLAAEDDGFYEHRGVDYTGLVRAFWVNLKAGRVVQGGSTITQQVAKSLLLTRERSLSRKIKDFLLAQKIEERFTKEEILFLYLNQVYLGSGFYGVKAALNGYFGKDLDEITIAEASMVAGLLVAPSKYSPMSNPEAAFKRQRYVLKRLLLTSKITEDEYKEAFDENIKFKIRKKNKFSAGYFTDWVRQDFIEKYGEEELLTNGYTINTTLDFDLQQVAEKSILEGVRQVDRRQGYKGNIGNISTAEEQSILDFDIRKKVYRKYSTFFTLNKDFEREYEVELNEQDYHNQVLFYDNTKDSFKIGDWTSGYNQEDQFLNYLHKGDSFKAVVQSVNDKARLIFVTLGGVSGFISYDNFKWAHERVIEANRKYFPFVTKPSVIVKAGDIIKVRVSKVKDSVWDKINLSYRKNIKDKDLVEKIKLQNYLNLELDQEVDVQAAIVSIDPFTGDVITLVGGTNFEKSQFNRALQSLRQPGSSFKPFIYAAGLEHGYNPSTVIMDSPESLTGAAGGPNWKPRNYDGKYLGPITFRTSLEKSRNIPTIKIAENVGISNIVDFVDRFGMIVKLEKDLGLSLGSFGITLLDLVESYGVFPNGGKQVSSRSIVSIIDRNGQDIWNKGLVDQVGKEVSDTELFTESDSVIDASAVSEKDPDINPFYKNLDGNQVFDSRLSYIMTNLLKGVIQNGTGRAAKKIGTYLGGKTGTTSNYVDAWFLGFSSKIVSGVWVGFDNNKTLGWGETGSKSALPIWSQVMDASLKKYGESDFDVPDGILNIGIDRKTGKIAKTHSLHPFIESFVEGYGPESISGELNNSSSVIYEEDEYFDEQ